MKRPDYRRSHIAKERPVINETVNRMEVEDVRTGTLTQNSSFMRRSVIVEQFRSLWTIIFITTESSLNLLPSKSPA
jgi:hypothetical protein